MNRTGPVGFERERNLPQFGHTTVAMRMSLLLPVIMAALAGVQSHAVFEGIRQSHPSSYSLMNHLFLMVLLPVPVIGLLMMRIDLETKQKLGLLLFFAYMALSILAQAAAYLRP